MNLRKDHYHTDPRSVFIVNLISVAASACILSSNFFAVHYVPLVQKPPHSIWKLAITKWPKAKVQLVWCFAPCALYKNLMTYNFQRWMSRFPQRWRTQRNAIRNANCKTSWIIKILNAHCAFGIFPVACLSECLWTPLSAGLFYKLAAGCFGFDHT